jgi:hypothetical protein
MSFNENTPLIVQGEGYVVEVVRGEVCVIDFSEAVENPGYAIEALGDAREAKAPAITINDLREIIASQRERGEGPWGDMTPAAAAAYAASIQLDAEARD